MPAQDPGDDDDGFHSDDGAGDVTTVAGVCDVRIGGIGFSKSLAHFLRDQLHGPFRCCHDCGIFYASNCDSPLEVVRYAENDVFVLQGDLDNVCDHCSDTCIHLLQNDRIFYLAFV